MARALAAVGLEHLQPLLGTADRWDQRLHEDEKQALAFARVFLHEPRWLVIDGALDGLNSASRARIEGQLASRAAQGLVIIGADSSRPGFFTRKLHLVTDPHGPSFNPADHFVIPAA